MTESVKIVLSGADKVHARLALCQNKAGKVLGRACLDQARIVFNQSQALVPFMYGTLQKSGRVRPPAIQGTTVSVELGYGTVYARRQHEETGWAHAPGRQAHYLSAPLTAAAATFGALVADRIDALLDGRLVL